MMRKKFKNSSKKFFFFEIILYRKISLLRDPDWGVLLWRSAVRDKKMNPYGHLAGTPPRNEKKCCNFHCCTTFLMFLPCWRRATPVVPCSFTYFQVSWNSNAFWWFLVDFNAFWCFLMVFGGFWCPFPLHNNKHRSCPRTQIYPFRLTKLHTNFRKRFKCFPRWYFAVRELCTTVFIIARFFS